MVMSGGTKNGPRRIRSSVFIFIFSIYILALKLEQEPEDGDRVNDY